VVRGAGRSIFQGSVSIDPLYRLPGRDSRLPLRIRRIWCEQFFGRHQPQTGGRALMRESSDPLWRNERSPISPCSQWERPAGLKYFRAIDRDSRYKELLESFVEPGWQSSRTERSSVGATPPDAPCRKNLRRYKPDRRKAPRFATSQTMDDENADLRLGGSSRFADED